MADTATLVVKILGDSSGVTKALGDVEKKSSGMQKALSTGAKVAGAALVGLTAFALSAANAAADDAKSQALLAQSMTKSAGATKEQIAATEDWISKTAAATGVADDQLRPALANLVRATGDVTKSQDAMGTALDVAAATGTDVESVSKAIAKGYAGQTTAIGRLVPGIDKAVLASGDMNAVMGELQSTMGGSAAAAADTAAGRMQRAQIAMDEAKESIGVGLLPVLSLLASMLTKVGTFAQQHATSFQIMIAVIAALAVAVIALNVAMTIMAATELIALAPLLLIIAAVVALIVVVILVVKNFDTLKGIAVQVWNAIKSAAEATWNAIKSAAQSVANFVVSAWNQIKAGAEAALNWIKSNWPLILAVLTGPIGIAVALIVKNWDKIKSAFETVTDKIGSLWDAAISGLKSSVSGLGEILSAPFDAMKSAIGWVIDKVNDLIGALSRIHVPKINLPGPLGAAASVAATPGVTARAAAPSVPFVSGRASSSGGGITINVTGAIDPEATARQIQRILSGHTRRVGLAS
jgi:phage-related protein